MQIGEQFGEWTIIAETGRRHRNRFVLCLCSCGTKQEMSYSILRAKQTTKCLRHFSNLAPVGKQFGEWEVIESSTIVGHHASVKAQCLVCKRKKLLRCADLIKKKNPHCRHRPPPPPPTQFRVGQKRGNYTIRRVAPLSLLLQCYCGRLVRFSTEKMREGKVPTWCKGHDLLDIKKGDVFGELTVREAPFQKGHATYAPVRCSCGKEYDLLTSALLKGGRKQCNYHRKHRFKVGDQIREWTILDIPQTPAKSSIVTIQCSCGMKKQVSYKNFIVKITRFFSHRHNKYGGSWNKEQQARRRKEAREKLGLSFLRVGKGAEAARVAFEFGAPCDTCRSISRGLQDGFRLVEEDRRARPTLYEKYGELNKITPEVVEQFTHCLEKVRILTEEERIEMLNSLLLVYAATTVETTDTYIPRLTKKWVKFMMLRKARKNGKFLSIEERPYFMENTTMQRYQEDLYNDSLPA